MRSILSLLLLFALAGPALAAEARAVFVTYQFAGNCLAGSDGNCAFFDLSEGDPVSGSITLDGARLSATEFASFLPTDPDLDFSFTFGNFSVGKNDLDPDEIRVMLSDSTGTGIIFQNSVFACLNAVFPCNVVTDGSEVLSIWTSFGTVTRHVGLGRQTAYTEGAWTIVPEPSPFVLLGLGIGGIAFARRRVAA